MIINVIFWGGNFLLQPSLYPVWPLMFASLLCCFLVTEDVGILKRHLENKYTVYLGTLSYSVYLMHCLVFEVFLYAIRLLARVQTIYDKEVFFKMFIDNQILGTASVIGAIIMTIYLSHLSYKWIETPMNNLYYRYNKST